MISIPHTICYYACNITKEYEMSRVRGTYGGVERCIHRLVGKLEGKIPLGNPRRRREVNIKTCFK